MTKKEVNSKQILEKDLEEKEKESTLKASYVIIGFTMFLIAIFIFIAFKNFLFLALLFIIMGVTFLISGVSYYDYGDLVKKINSKEDFDVFYLREEWHQEIKISTYLSFGIGILFLGISVILLFLNPKELFLAILFCDTIGATVLVYAFKLKEYREKIEEYEDKMEDMIKEVNEKNWAFQGINSKNENL